METPWTSQVLAAALATARTTSLAAALLVAGLLAAHATGLLAAVAQRGRLLLERLVAGETLRGYLAGLDGGAQGHWGNQNEDVWADGRWNQTELGSLLCGVFRGGGATVLALIFG